MSDSSFEAFLGYRAPKDNLDYMLKKIEGNSNLMEGVLADAQKFGIGLSAEQKAELEKTGKSPRELFSEATRDEKYTFLTRVMYLAKVKYEQLDELTRELPRSLNANVLSCYLGMERSKPSLLSKNVETYEEESALYGFTEDMFNTAKNANRVVRASLN